MPAKKPYRKTDRWANEKQLATDIGSGINDVFGRGTLAGLLGAPGDIAGMAENGIRALIGLPQVRPWGGSEHIGQKMQDYGLVSSVRRPKTELLASLISPAQIATASLKAPQYAKTALRLLDNLESAPTMARIGQRGAIDVWHGSPHKFDTFKAMDNIGGGEGAQAYGHGGYHASSPEVAKKYQEVVTAQKMPIDSADDVAISTAKNFGIMYKNEPEKRVAMMRSIYGDKADEYIARADGINGNLYRNQLRWPDPAREAADPLSDKHFLDWDKPLSEQSPEVAGAFKKAMESRRAELTPPDDPERWLSQLMALDSAPSYYTGGGSAKALSASFPLEDLDAMRETSKLLNQQGIPGIRYLDGGSRSAGQGSYNYVTFDDALVNILERNGQPVTAPQPGLLGKMIAPQDEALRVAQQNAAKPVSEGGLGLRPDNTPEERAAAMGFDTDAYHATPYDFNEFIVPNYRGASFFAADPKGAAAGSAAGGGDSIGVRVGADRVLPVKLRSDDIYGLTPTKAESSWLSSVPNELDESGVKNAMKSAPSQNYWWKWFDEVETPNGFVYRKKQIGKSYADAVGSGKDAYGQSPSDYGAASGERFSADNAIANDKRGFMQYDEGGLSVGITDPTRIRSRFAAFDPMRRDSSDLLAGLSPLLLARPQDKEKKK